MGFELIAVICGMVFWVTGSTAQYVDEQKHPEKYAVRWERKLARQEEWRTWWADNPISREKREVESRRLRSLRYLETGGAIPEWNPKVRNED